MSLYSRLQVVSITFVMGGRACVLLSEVQSVVSGEGVYGRLYSIATRVSVVMVSVG